MPARPPPAWVLATTVLKIRVGVCLAGEVLVPGALPVDVVRTCAAGVQMG